MIAELTQKIRAAGLDWKPSSLEILRLECDEDTSASLKVACADGSELTLPFVSSIKCLGAEIDGKARTTTASAHREVVAEAVFSKHKAELCRRDSPWKLRLEALVATVFAAYLHSSEGHVWDRPYLHHLQALERRWLRRMGHWRPCSRVQEGWTQFQERTARRVNELFLEHGLPRLAELVIARGHRWARHTRFALWEDGAPMPAGQVAFARTANWWQSIRGSLKTHYKGPLRHRTQGSTRQWEGTFRDALGKVGWRSCLDIKIRKFGTEP